MQIPWVECPAQVRGLFQTTTDVVIVDVYDMFIFDDEGEEKDPIDGCRVFVRTRRITKKICEVTGWHPDKIINRDLGYAPAAVFTLARDPEIVRYQLERFLDTEQIYRKGCWVNIS